jgi:hypothetical protein
MFTSNKEALHGFSDEDLCEELLRRERRRSSRQIRWLRELSLEAKQRIAELEQCSTLVRCSCR